MTDTQLTEYTKLKEQSLPKSFTVVARHNGWIMKRGKSAGQIYNPYWLVTDKTIQDTPFYVMYCKVNTLCLFSAESLEALTTVDEEGKHQAWYKDVNGYMCTHKNKSCIYMHQVVMNHFAKKDDSELSVDHINKNKLDNRTNNLRLATQAEQNRNTDKRKRKHNAQVLPPEIEQIELPKFVVYYREKVSKNPDRYREFFRIEKHPKQGPTERWASTKSNKISILEKLEATKEKLNSLNAV